MKPEPTWLEASVTVDSELAEAVAEVFSRYAPEGVVIESTAVTASPDDSEGRAVGPLKVRAYLLIDASIEETRHLLEEALWYLGRIRSLPAIEYQFIREADWAEAWKEHFHPIEIGKSMLIIPAWLDITNRERLPIRIDPGMAFGTGTHPTTQLCLEMIEEYAVQAEKSTWEVIDLGCGSGILAIAAVLLGSHRSLGVDIDPEAIRAAQSNAELNRIANRLELSVGSLAEIQAGAYSIKQAGLVLANILSPVIIRLLDEGLADLVAPGGWLVLSGILAEQSPEVEGALGRNNLQLIRQLQHGDWVALCATQLSV